MPSISLRASSIDKFLDCPRSMFAQTYSKLLHDAGYKYDDPVSWVTSGVGTGVHASADHQNKVYIETGVLPSEKQIEESCLVGHAAFRSDLIKRMELTEVRFTNRFPDIPTINAHISEYAKFYAKAILPTRTLILSEHKFNFKLNDQFDIFSTLDSYGSLISAPETKTLLDLKSGDKISSHHGQMGVYAFLLMSTGYEVHDIQVDYIKRPKDGEPPEHRVFKYNADACVRLAKQAMGKIMSDLIDFQKTGNIDVFVYNPKTKGCDFCALNRGPLCTGWQNK